MRKGSAHQRGERWIQVDRRKEPGLETSHVDHVRIWDRQDGRSPQADGSWGLLGHSERWSLEHSAEDSDSAGSHLCLIPKKNKSEQHGSSKLIIKNTTDTLLVIEIHNHIYSIKIQWLDDTGHFTDTQSEIWRSHTSCYQGQISYLKEFWIFITKIHVLPCDRAHLFTTLQQQRVRIIDSEGLFTPSLE